MSGAPCVAQVKTKMQAEARFAAAGPMAVARTVLTCTTHMVHSHPAVVHLPL